MAASFSVFLSYRREDTRHLSARIYEQLERHFGDGHVFFDVDSLPRYAGWDFEDVIRETVPQCRVFLAIIGRDWARLMRARLRDPKDFVQIELAIALNTPGVRVIPVLVDGAAMPTAADLPEALRGLLGKQNVVLPPDPHLRQAVNDLAKTLLATPAPPVQPPPPVAPPPPPPKPTALERAEAKAEALMQAKGPSLPGWLLPVGLVAGVLALAFFILTNRPPEPIAKDDAPVTAVETPPATASETSAQSAATPLPEPSPPLAAPSIPLPDMVRIPGQNFEAGRYEVTFVEWEACVADGGCNGYRPSDEGWGRGRRPVINVNWNDAQAYLQWLNQRSGRRYRLLTESEWEIAARAGTTTEYSWGDDPPVCDQNARNGANLPDCTDNRTRPVGSFRPNGFGLYDVHGNVWEWVQDAEGSSRVLRGGSWYNFFPQLFRFAYRDSRNPSIRNINFGFRLARTL